VSLALSCDFRIADKTITFGIPASRMGIVYGWRECQQLASVVGVPQARRILFAGERHDAAYAQATGFADITDKDPLAAARDLAETCATRAPLSISGMKLALNAIEYGELDSFKAELEAAEKAAMDSEDYREAVAAFGEKRTPRFTGR
jgi:enoyl-CoA hydratase/carnithine racemase